MSDCWMLFDPWHTAMATYFHIDLSILHNYKEWSISKEIGINTLHNFQWTLHSPYLFICKSSYHTMGFVCEVLIFVRFCGLANFGFNSVTAACVNVLCLVIWLAFVFLQVSYIFQVSGNFCFAAVPDLKLKSSFCTQFITVTVQHFSNCKSTKHPCKHGILVPYSLL